MSAKKSTSDPAKPGDPGELLLSQAVAMLRPLVDLMISQGVGFPSMARALRTAFVQAARRQLEGEDGPVTDAAISLRSGVHRKEVRSVNDAQGSAGDIQSGPPERSLSIAEQVYTRWTTDAAYRDANSEPATLPVSGAAPSFESLVSSVTRDFSRRTVLDELVRIGLVRVKDKQVEPLAAAMVPPKAWNELAQYLSDHVHDHLAAGAANLNAARGREKAPFLEHSMYANGLSDQSIEQLSRLARDAWQPAFNQMVGAARQRFDLDEAEQHQGRLRFGVYFYSEPDVTDEPKADATDNLQVPKPTKKRSPAKAAATRSTKKQSPARDKPASATQPGGGRAPSRHAATRRRKS